MNTSMKKASRTQISLLITLLLLIVSLIIVIVSIRMTVSEVNHFKQQHTLATKKDVRAIRPWMTLSYISRFYHVPEPYLVDALHLTDARDADHLPIQTLAERNSRSVSDLTYSLQVAINTYHRDHPEQKTPTPIASHTTHSPPGTVANHGLFLAKSAACVVQRFIAGVRSQQRTLIHGWTTHMTGYVVEFSSSYTFIQVRSVRI